VSTDSSGIKISFRLEKRLGFSTGPDANEKLSEHPTTATCAQDLVPPDEPRPR
jgi:hypothetical protein